VARGRFGRSYRHEGYERGQPGTGMLLLLLLLCLINGIWVRVCTRLGNTAFYATLLDGFKNGFFYVKDKDDHLAWEGFAAAGLS
jgi:hypothetical protein